MPQVISHDFNPLKVSQLHLWPVIWVSLGSADGGSSRARRLSQGGDRLFNIPEEVLMHSARVADVLATDMQVRRARFNLR